MEAPLTFEGAALLTSSKLSGRYEIEAELGRGGMGAVYRALDCATGDRVALKTLQHDSPVVTALFEREYYTLASLKHARIIRVYEFGITDTGTRYYTMELLPGDDLAGLAPLPWRQVCQHLRDVAASLALLHARRLLHRDVSPRNVRFDADGRAKLIDFGALCSFGTATEIVGTAQCMAPEVVRALPLDHRTDLFSLGCVAYWALTGRSAYNSRSVYEAEDAFRTPPVPPSKLLPDLPKALEQLVLSMLSLDPMERPASAAEVIERLHAIVGLADEPLADIARTHLLGSTLVGRERETAQLRLHLTRMLRGQGACVTVEGAAGSGRSRLLTELALDARIAGAATIRIETLAHPGPFDALRALTRALLEAAPAEATETLPAYLGVLGQVFEELHSRGVARTRLRAEELPRDPAERRARVQAAVADWLIAVARRRRLVLLLDDVHALDTESAGCLVLLAHAAQQEPLMFVASLCAGANLPAAVAQLERLGARIKLRPLDRGGVDRLLESVFGEVPHRLRLSQWLHALGDGYPGHTFTLLSELLARHVIRYEAGAWVLPSELSDRDLPVSLEDILEQRVAQLEPAARQLGQIFALHRGVLPLSVCLKLLPELSQEALAVALDQLTARDVLISAGDGYRIAQEPLRNLLRASLDGQTLAALHRTLAHALRETYPQVFRALSAGHTDNLSTAELSTALHMGWYLVHGGALDEGHAILRDAAIALTVRGDGLVEAVPALEVALAAYREQGRDPFDEAPLLMPLTLAGTYADWRLGYRHGEEAMSRLCEVSGIDRARRLSRWLGSKLALAIALGIAFLTFHLSSRRRITPSFRDVFLGLMGLGSALIGTYIVLEDRERARKLCERLSPLAWFPHPINVIHGFQRSMLENSFGRYTQSSTLGREVLEVLKAPEGLKGFPEDARAQLIVGLCLLLGHMDEFRTDGRSHEIIRVLEGLPTSVSRQAIAGLLASYHAHRGERTQYAAFQGQLDLLAAQAGATWRHDVMGPRHMWATFALCEDVMALKRTYRYLDSLVDELPPLRRIRNAVHAAYLCERGMHAEALAQYASTFEAVIADSAVEGLLYAGVYARILRSCGQAARAREVCTSALNLSEADLEFTVAAIGPQLELVLAHAALGELDRADTALAKLESAQRTHDNPMLHGLVHKVAAQVALTRRDQSEFEKQHAAMEQHFRRTDNPALISQCQRLSEEARNAGLIEAAARSTSLHSSAHYGSSSQVEATLNACRSPAERLHAALNLVLEATGAERGYLYLSEPDGLKFAAPNVGLEPPEELRERLQELLAGQRALGSTPGQALRELDGGRTTTVILAEYELIALTPDAAGGRTYRGVVLCCPRGSELVLIGVVALASDDEPLALVSPVYLQEISRGIYSAGDVHTVYLNGRAVGVAANQNAIAVPMTTELTM